MATPTSEDILPTHKVSASKLRKFPEMSSDETSNLSKAHEMRESIAVK